LSYVVKHLSHHPAFIAFSFLTPFWIFRLPLAKNERRNMGVISTNIDGVIYRVDLLEVLGSGPRPTNLTRKQGGVTYEEDIVPGFRRLRTGKGGKDEK